jgi:hypothetical protein
MEIILETEIPRKLHGGKTGTEQRRQHFNLGIIVTTFGVSNFLYPCIIPLRVVRLENVPT